GPGSCPICGMALEPADVSAVEGDDPELRDMTRRLVVCAVPTLAIFAMAMGDMLPGRPVSHAMPHGVRAWLELLLATPGGVRGGRVLRPRRRVPPDGDPQHVHPDRARHGHGLGHERRGDAHARALPAVVPRPRRRGDALLRVGRGDHDARAPGPGAGAAGAG